MLDPQISESQISESQHGEATAFHGDLGVVVRQPSVGLAVLTVRGEIDALTTPQLESAVDELLAVPADRFVIDLSEVAFLASSGLAVLIRAAQLTAQRGHRLRLVVATRAVRRPLQITGSDQLFDLFDDPDAATGAPV